jgi:proline dehydrogenase
MFKALGFIGKHALLQRSAVSGNATRSRLGSRSASSQVTNRKHPRSILVASGGILVALGLSPFYAGRAHADSEAQLTSKSNETSLGALIRSYAVYTMFSIPALVDHSPRILELASIPGLKWITEAFVRITFFDQFVGGDTAQKAVPLLHSLRAANKGALFAYSVEVEEAEATAFAQSHAKHKGPPPHKRIVDEMIHCIDVAADFEDSFTDKSTGGRRTWVAIKIVSLVTIISLVS